MAIAYQEIFNPEKSMLDEHIPKFIEQLRVDRREQEIAIAIANKALDRIGADRDDDLATVSRQLLRSIETNQKLAAELNRRKGDDGS